MPTNPDWDPRAPAVLDDQRRAYDELRARCPVAYSEFLGWSLFRYQDVLRVATDPVTFSSHAKRRVIPNGMDPPEHTEYRRLLDPYFDPEHMAAFEPICRTMARRLIGPIVASGEEDLIAALAEPYSFGALCAFVGWPREDWPRVAGWIQANRGAAFTRDAVMGAAAARDVAEYVGRDLAARRVGTSDGRAVRESAGNEDLTTTLLAATVGGVPLSDDDIVSILRNVIAGHGSTAASIGVVALYLAEHVEVQESVRADPSLLPVAIDEMLRMDDPLIALGRTATRDVERPAIGPHGSLGRISTTDVEIGGRTILGGERISLMWTSANRDESAFPEPETLRMDRGPNASLVFGAGIHRCLGEGLARLEIRIVVEELLASTTAILPAGSTPAERNVYPSNGIQSLPLRFRRAGPMGEV